MKKIIVFFLLAIFSISSWAGEFNELKGKMSAARASLMVLMSDKDKRDATQQQKVKQTADAVSSAIEKMKAPAGKEAQFKELSETWAAFKETREKELVPAILAGKDDEAKAIANGVQKERYVRCQKLIDLLDH